MNKITRRRYTPEFKAEAVALVEKQGYKISEAAKALGINRKLLDRWLAKVSATSISDSRPPLTRMPDHQCQKLAPAGKGIAPPWCIQLRRQSLESKSRYELEKLTKYSSMVGHSPIPRFDSTFCDEAIVSNTAPESGYLVELRGTAVRPP